MSLQATFKQYQDLKQAHAGVLQEQQALMQQLEGQKVEVSKLQAQIEGSRTAAHVVSQAGRGQGLYCRPA